MSREVLDEAVSLALSSAAATVGLVFYGGEPLLEFRLLRRAVSRVEAAGSRPGRIRFSLATNGLLLGERETEFLEAHDVRTQISFDGVKEAQDQRAPGTFARLDALLRRLAERHPSFLERRVAVAVTLTPRNLRLLPRSVTYFLERGVREIRITPRMTPDPDWRPGIRPQLERVVARVFRLCVRHFDETGRVPLAWFRHVEGDTSRRRVRPTCGARLGTHLTVAPDGRAHPCPLLSDAYQDPSRAPLRRLVEVTSLGDLRDRGFRRRWACAPAAAAASGFFDRWEERRSRYGRCKDCRFIESCEVCPVSLAHFTEEADVGRVPDFPCAVTRVVGRWRERFPAAPSVPAVLTGRAPIPEACSRLVRAVSDRRS